MHQPKTFDELLNLMEAARYGEPHYEHEFAVEIPALDGAEFIVKADIEFDYEDAEPWDVNGRWRRIKKPKYFTRVAVYGRDIDNQNVIGFVPVTNEAVKDMAIAIAWKEAQTVDYP